MSTRSTINFSYEAPTAEGAEPEAKIYRHCDGYPGKADGSKYGVLPDLATFFAAVEEQTADTRFSDPSYLAAKFVVWQAGENAGSGKPLDFISLGIVTQDPGDIEYTYWLDCGTLVGGRPTVYWKAAGATGRWAKAKYPKK